ncbi:MAG TPA: nicotinate-nucleotide adenylyltransferase [Gemmatimonadaceae bacterium]
MRLGIFGGTFDPPHVGHLLVAIDAYEALSLDRMLVIPAAAQPLKGASPAVASAEHRLEMVRRAFRDDSRFEVSDTEIERRGLSYTVDTLEEIAAQRQGDELTLLLGRDAISSFDRWKSPDRILQLARLAVIERAGMKKEERDAYEGVIERTGATMVTTRRVDVSSTEIRRRLKEGLSIRGFVVDSVDAYIAAEKLYKS